jgi:hypothetical protein
MTLRLISTGIALGLATLVLPAGPALAQNAMGQTLTPFSTSSNPDGGFSHPSSGGMGSGGMGSGGSGSGGHHGGHNHGFPFVVFPFWSNSIDDGGTGSVQSNPVNTAPFAPPPPPTAAERAPTAPYKPPSVEIAPGGIEIVRGPG